MQADSLTAAEHQWRGEELDEEIKSTRGDRAGTLEQLLRALDPGHYGPSATEVVAAVAGTAVHGPGQVGVIQQSPSLDIRLSPELMFGREEDDLLRHLHGFHIRALKSSCRPAIYQVPFILHMTGLFVNLLINNLNCYLPSERVISTGFLKFFGLFSKMNI